MSEVLNTQRVFFKSAGHKQRFLNIMQQLGKVYGGKYDEEYAAALYILTSALGIWEKAEGYVDRSGIDFDVMLGEEHFTTGQAVLIRLAGNLFSGDQHVDPHEFYGTLDDENFVVALEALQLRRHGYPMM